jgi:sensor histidine kinase YesM
MESVLPVFEAPRREYRVKDLPARIIGIPLISLLMYMTFGRIKGVYDNNYLEGIAVSFFYTIGYWEGIRKIWMILARRYPHYTQTRIRITRLVLAILVYGAFLSVLIPAVSRLMFGTGCTPEIMVWGYLVGLIPTAVVLVLYEATYFFHAWKTKVQEAEALERSQLINQLDVLKAQLDPHFLFNSLNTLSSLIDENEPAQEYLSRLADVYRYVLLSRDRNTVSLEEEMEFVRAYLYLAKVRFQDSLQLDIHIPTSSYHHLVAPLSIQLLVENALKHNVASKESPLLIRITESEGYIRVSNEIRPKAVLHQESTKVGLQNILERYRLLSDQPVRILDQANLFEVSIPLLPA